MNKIILTAITVCIIGASVMAQAKETISGNGKTETRNVPVQPFTEIKVSGIFELVLSQGIESVKIEADENLQEYFTVKNEGPKLVVDMEKLKNKNLKSSGKMKVYLSFKNISAMDLKTIGNVNSSEQLNFDILKIKYLNKKSFNS